MICTGPAARTQAETLKAVNTRQRARRWSLGEQSSRAGSAFPQPEEHQIPLPGAFVLPPVTWQALPAWLSELVENTWHKPEWDTWERVWRPELAKRGVTPDMLEPVGSPERPTGISAASPDRGWRSGGIEWETDADLTAVLTGMRRLVTELDRA